MVYSHHGILLSNKNQRILLNGMPWVTHKVIEPGERSQVQKSTFSAVPFVTNSRKYKLICGERKQSESLPVHLDGWREAWFTRGVMSVFIFLTEIVALWMLC